MQCEKMLHNVEALLAKVYWRLDVGDSQGVEALAVLCTRCLPDSIQILATSTSLSKHDYDTVKI